MAKRVRKYHRSKKLRVPLISAFLFLGIFIFGFFLNDYKQVSYEAELGQIELSLSEEHDSLVVKKGEKSAVKPALEDPAVLAEKIEKEIIPAPIIIKVPFIPQAPLAEWEDPRQQDGCEEAASLMAISWAQGGDLNPAKAKEAILEISKYEEDKIGTYIDTSASTTLSTIINGYFSYENARVVYNFAIADIVRELENNNLVIVPTNGQLLNNPHYNPPGPERHNLLIIGYDYESKEFITHDPGTRMGKEYRYAEAVLFNAIIDYPTGDHQPIISPAKAMIVVSK